MKKVVSCVNLLDMLLYYPCFEILILLSSTILLLTYVKEDKIQNVQ